jgi:hypothetical protein
LIDFELVGIENHAADSPPELLKPYLAYVRSSLAWIYSDFGGFSLTF